MDNTAKDNKNKYVLAFAGWLAFRRFFRRVHVGCLSVGHTHEDIDRLFSRLSVGISTFSRQEEQQRWRVETMTELAQAISQAHTPAPRVEILNDVYDWKSFLAPVSLATVEGTMSNRAFCFSVDTCLGMTNMQYRPWTFPPPEFADLSDARFQWNGGMENIPYFGPISIPRYELVGQVSALKVLPRHPQQTTLLRSEVQKVRDGSSMSSDGFTRFVQELDAMDAEYEDEARRRDCSTCTRLTHSLREIVIHQSDRAVVNGDEKKVNTVKTKERSRLNAELSTHMQQDNTRHPPVTFDLPTTSLPQQELTSLMDKTVVTQAELDKIQKGMQWIESSKQRNHNDALLKNDEKGLLVSLQAMTVAMNAGRARLTRLQQERELAVKQKADEENLARMQERTETLRQLTESAKADLAREKADFLALQEDKRRQDDHEKSQIDLEGIQQVSLKRKTPGPVLPYTPRVHTAEEAKAIVANLAVGVEITSIWDGAWVQGQITKVTSTRLYVTYVGTGQVYFTKASFERELQSGEAAVCTASVRT